MATDAAILTAARAHYTAIADLKEADATVARLQGELQKAGQVADEKRKYANECQRHLLQLSAQKPSEPAPKPVEGVTVSVTGKDAESLLKEVKEQGLPVKTSGGGNFPPPTTPVPNLSRKR